MYASVVEAFRFVFEFKHRINQYRRFSKWNVDKIRHNDDRQINQWWWYFKTLYIGFCHHQMISYTRVTDGDTHNRIFFVFFIRNLNQDTIDEIRTLIILIRRTISLIKYLRVIIIFVYIPLTSGRESIIFRACTEFEMFSSDDRISGNKWNTSKWHSSSNIFAFYHV